MSHGLVTAAYIVAAVLFILTLAGVSSSESDKNGVYYATAGLVIALFATFFRSYTAVLC